VTPDTHAAARRWTILLDTCGVRPEARGFRFRNRREDATAVRAVVVRAAKRVEHEAADVAVVGAACCRPRCLSGAVSIVPRGYRVGLPPEAESRVAGLPLGSRKRGVGGVSAIELLDAYLHVEDADALHAEYAARGVEFTRGLGNTPWRSREFVVKDCDGRLLAFGASLDDRIGTSQAR
jgi:hypothetical protein